MTSFGDNRERAFSTVFDTDRVKTASTVQHHPTRRLDSYDIQGVPKLCHAHFLIQPTNDRWLNGREAHAWGQPQLTPVELITIVYWALVVENLSRGDRRSRNGKEDWLLQTAKLLNLSLDWLSQLAHARWPRGRNCLTDAGLASAVIC